MVSLVSCGRMPTIDKLYTPTETTQNLLAIQREGDLNSMQLRHLRTYLAFAQVVHSDRFPLEGYTYRQLVEPAEQFFTDPPPPPPGFRTSDFPITAQ